MQKKYLFSTNKNHFVKKASIYTIAIILLTAAFFPIASSCHTPKIKIVKTGPIFAYAGDEITYTYYVKNKGDVPLINITVSDNKCGPVNYFSGDTNENEKLDINETWIFTCTYTPEFDFPNKLKNKATASGEWNSQIVEDIDWYRLCPFILRKDVLLYLQEENVDYNDSDTQFKINMSKNEEVIETFTINESNPLHLWLSKGTYQFCEIDLPDGYESVYDCISYDTGENYSDFSYQNVITFDLVIEKSGSENCTPGDNITYYYQVSNNGPASVTPIVEDDICGTPLFTGGDTNDNNLIDPGEIWTYECIYTVVEEVGSFIQNTVNVTDTEGASREPDQWWLGGDRNLNNNIDEWSVEVIEEPEEPKEPEEPQEPEEPDEPEEPEEPEYPKEPEEPEYPEQPNGPTQSFSNSKFGNSGPIANAGGPYYGVIEEGIEFDGSGSYDKDGTITYYGWTFGNGETRFEEIITTSYSSSGSFLVTLIVFDNNGASDTDTTTAFITIPNRPPTIPIISGPTRGIKEILYAYTFGSTDLDNDNIKYLIEWGDGFTFDSGNLPSGHLFSMLHSWSNPGEYTITVTASDDQTTSQSEMTVVVEENAMDYIAIVILGLLVLIALTITMLYNRKDKKKK